MKKILIAALAFSIAAPAFAADNVVIRRSEGSEVRKLPGNTTILTGDGGGPSGVYIEGDDDIARSLLLGPRVRVYGDRYDGTYSSRSRNDGYDSITATCPANLSDREQRKCLRDLAKAQQKIRRRYND